jgi:predicted membrane channel-forming protein YqfA (hemolysin III family)
MTMQQTGVRDAIASAPYTRLESRAEWRVDAVVHVGGMTLGLAACVALAMLVLPSEGSATLMSIAVYAAGLLAMLGSSALYNLAVDGSR